MFKSISLIVLLSWFGIFPQPILMPSPQIPDENDLAALTVPDPLPAFTKAQEKQLNCVAEAVYFEARGESREGRKAVATVVFNRAKSSRFPDNFCAVVYQRNPLGCQFTWVCGDHSISNRRLYDMILADVKASFDLRRLDQFHDITHGALYFSSIEPDSHSSVRIGSQYFWSRS